MWQAVDSFDSGWSVHTAGMAERGATSARRPPKARIGRSESTLEKLLQRLLENHERTAVLRASDGDADLAGVVMPLAPVLH